MKNWRETIVKSDANITEALTALNNAAQKIVLVCDESNRLLSVVSDGDIRRGLLSGLHMDDPITAVANTSPRTAPIGLSHNEIKRVFADEGLNVLPILDDQQHVVGLHTISSISERPALENSAFIMAGGFGTRLKPLTDNCPKPMLPIGGKPILEHTIERMRKQGFRKFFISTHYLPDKIMDHFGDGSLFDVQISYVHEETPLGTGGALGLLPSDVIDKPLILLNGDILTDLDFTKLLGAHEIDDADATMCLREQETSLAYGVVEVKGNRVIRMEEKPIYRHLINTGIYVLSNKCVQAVQRGQRLDLPSLLDHRIQSNHVVNSYIFYGNWVDIGQTNDYLQAKAAFNSIYPAE